MTTRKTPFAVNPAGFTARAHATDAAEPGSALLRQIGGAA